jgi:signal transduction histidine kinase
MESITINAAQAKEVLAQLQTEIRQQRRLLQNGIARETLDTQMQTWETMIRQIQIDMMLEKSAHLNMLYDISRSINASLDWRQTLQAVLDAFIQITTAERGMILLLDAHGEPRVEMTRSAPYTLFADGAPGDEIKFSHSIVNQALLKKSPILSTNAQVDPRFNGSDSIMAYGLRATLCVPLICNGETLGAIYLDNRARSGVFTEEDMTSLSAFAHHAAIALHNARIHQKTDQALTERMRELAILQEMMRDLNTSLHFNRVMERSTVWAIAASGAEAGAIGLIAEDGIRWLAKDSAITPNNLWAMRCISTREPIIEEHYLVLPLLRDTRPIGVLYLTSEAQPFKARKLEFVTRVADNIAVAVENARLYEALRQASLTKSEFVSTMSHELRTPMACVLGYSDMLKTGMAGELSTQQEEFVDNIAQSINRIINIVNDLADISEMEAGRLRLSLRTVDFNTVVDETMTTLQENAEKKRLRYTRDSWAGLPQAYADQERLKQILTILLRNAIQYTPEEGTVTVKAWLSTDEPDFIRCAVTDTGIGISPQNQVRLFTKFFRAANPTAAEQNGTGLGMVIAKNLVEMHGGRVWLESAPGKGSNFFFTIPIAMPGL